MKTLLFLIISIFAMAKRVLFWLAIVQQKEYRIDRLRLYLATTEGRTELWSLLPRRSWLNFKFWKRPHWTARLIIVAATWSLIVMALLFLCYWLQSYWLQNMGWSVPFWLNLIFTLIWIILIYVLSPWLILIGLWPTTFISILATQYVSLRAKSLVQHYRPIVIGITGSYGKTSTKQLLAHILAAKYSVFATPSSFNTRYSVAKSIAYDYKGEEIMILEYGAYKVGEIAKLCQVVSPQLAVITGITAQHLGIFGSLDAIVAAKSELVTALPPNGVVFYNAGDLLTGAVATAFAGIKYGYNVSGKSQVQSAGLASQGKLELVLDDVVVSTQLVGLHYLSSIEAVLAIGEHLGVPRSQIIARLMSFQPTTSFTHIYDIRNKSSLLDDGQTSNPAGFQAMLALARSLHGTPKILVFGGIVDLGDESSRIHLQLAKVTTDIFDQVWYPSQIGLAEFMQDKTNWVIYDREQILKKLKTLSPGTLLAVEGKLPAWLDQPLHKLRELT